MDDITKLVAEKTGLTLEQSKQAVETVLDYLKMQNPLIRVMLDDLLKGGEQKRSTSEVSKTQSETTNPNDFIGSVGDILGSLGGDDPES